ncbi:MAG TPA: preprotein translocase subunit YajC [Deltaproteobacteria bacterium]|nr:preprotein translocase subunit YajC [Deltaproteobacteria bacterium]HQB38998.1 preprotein translocase subunit YajC [Deltaproteobacteria bacterium]
MFGSVSMAQFQQFVPLILMFAIFYFLLIRPQQKKAKEHKALMADLKKGDNVLTASGIYGKIVSVEDSQVNLEIANGVVIKLVKEHVAAVVNK